MLLNCIFISLFSISVIEDTGLLFVGTDGQSA